MRFDTANSGFVAGVVSWLRSLDDDILSDVRSVLRLSPGYYPTTIVEYWEQEITRRGLHVQSHSISGHHLSSLPVCHPCDYEWRFTADATAELCSLACSGLEAGSTVVHVGTPSTFATSLEMDSSFRHVLIERNDAVIMALNAVAHTEHKIIRIDLTTDEPPVIEAKAAVIDPPWYPVDTTIFLAATSCMSVEGARILLCQPTEATRPGVAEERAQLLAELPELGYELCEIRRSYIRYQMPHFESVSLKAAAPSLEVPIDWRTGDLLILRRVGRACHITTATFSEAAWQESVFGPVRIKLRSTTGPDITSLVSGDVLDTVSRRDPIRVHIGMWTSGNRVFRLTNAEVIGKLIEFCHTDFMNAQFTLKRTLAHATTLGVSARVARRLFDVLLIELQEHLNIPYERVA
jgi:hypothetical protein